jgi:hypothetical protein
MNNYALKMNFNSKKEVNMESVLAIKVTAFPANRALFIKVLAVNGFGAKGVTLVEIPIK